MTGTPVKTTCPYCGVGCGVIATLQADGTVDVVGDPDHPANYGRLCSKGAALGETTGLAGRLLHPEIGGRRTDWDSALNRVATTFSRTIAEHGPDSVAFYVSGQLLTEDYYVANKLMKGYIGSANIDTNSRLCMASSVAGHKRAFGSDTVPGTYRDLELADLVVLVGSNLAWCHPVLQQRLAAAKAERPAMRIVVIDPRATATTEFADMHLALRPDSDVALFAGLLDALHRSGKLDKRFVLQHTTGWGEALRCSESIGIEEAVARTGLPREQIQRFYALFADTEKCVTVYSQGVNQSRSGTDKVNAILNCHLFTGRIGRPGMGPFSVTGQPNAMGGREVGGLANQLACHMALDNETHRGIVRDFWRSPRIAWREGLKAVELFDAIHTGDVKAVWVMGTNPADSLPNAAKVVETLDRCAFTVVSDVMRDTDTTRHADVLLPAAAWGEKSGTVTNSERRISRQKPFLPMPGETRADWRIVCEVAQRMGFGAAFEYGSGADIFREYAALSAADNGGQRDFDIGGLADINDTGYDELAPVQWPVRRDAAPGPWDQRFFADGRFFTATGKAQMVPTPLPDAVSAGEMQLVLNSGRVRDHWHTMTRTGLSPRLSRHLAEPFCEIHPTDAARYGIDHATLVELEGAGCKAVLRILITDRQKPGTLFAPMHWTGQFAEMGRIGRVIDTGTDPVSGQPALKSALVTIRPFAPAWYGFAVLRNRPASFNTDYWALARAEGGWRLELACRRTPRDWPDYARRLFAANSGTALLAYQDRARHRFHFALYDEGVLLGALFVGSEPVAVSRSWAADRLTAPAASAAEQMKTLAGRGGANLPDPGATICTCFSIGINQITDTIQTEGCRTVADVGAALGAGTNCGSCRSEIEGILNATDIREAV
jgi:assimilatory nitrate reductase catalytic subunit